MTSKIVHPSLPEVGEWAQEVEPDDLEAVFRKLVDEWRTAVAPLSSTTRRIQHPAYQKIIALGPKVVPLVLRELKERPNLWFAALQALTDANPVPISDRGKIIQMTEAWVRWGEEHGYL